MQREEYLSEIATLRYHLHVNNRMRLEFLAGLSKLFREYDVPATDELLSTMVLAVPQELANTNDSVRIQAQYGSSGSEPDPPTSPTEPDEGSEPDPPTEPEGSEPDPPTSPTEPDEGSEPLPPTPPS